MRIDAFNKVSQLYQAGSTKKLSKPGSNGSTSDRLEISQAGKDYQVAKQAVLAVSDVRQDKIDEIKQQMATGTYDVSDDALANKLLDGYFGTAI